MSGWCVNINHSKENYVPLLTTYVTKARINLTEHIEDGGPAEVTCEKPRERQRNHCAHVTARASETCQMTAL